MLKISCQFGNHRNTAPIDINGQTIGRWKVIANAGKDKHGALTFNCRCVDCGLGKIITGRVLRSGMNPLCGNCKPPYKPTPRIDTVGKTINGWYVAEQAGTNDHGTILFKCRCVKCGYETLKTSGAVRRKIVPRCAKCPPQYNFEYENAFARGILPDGTRFLVDADMVDKIKDTFWHRNYKGYLVFEKPRKPATYLHRVVLDVGGDIIVDHINRDKTDNRRENLRVVTPAQNSYNKSLQPYNTTGYVGMSWIPKKQCWQARIGCYCRNLALGDFKDIETAAEAYNIATDYLFGEHRGHTNDVPKQSAEFIANIEGKCRRFKQKYMR